MMPDDSTLTEVTRSVWETMLGVPIDGPTAAGADPSLWMAVDITGGWEGTVMLGVPDVLARRAAATMLDLPAIAASADDTREAIAELTNMLGGNLKGLLPGHNRLSLPRVASAPAAGNRLWFGCADASFAVVMSEKATAP